MSTLFRLPTINLIQYKSTAEQPKTNCHHPVTKYTECFNSADKLEMPKVKILKTLVELFDCAYLITGLRISSSTNGLSY